MNTIYKNKTHTLNTQTKQQFRLSRNYRTTCQRFVIATLSEAHMTLLRVVLRNCLGLVGSRNGFERVISNSN